MPRCATAANNLPRRSPAVNNVQRRRKVNRQPSAAPQGIPAAPPADDACAAAAAAAQAAPLPPTIGELLKTRPDVVVVDEAHVIKTETVSGAAAGRALLARPSTSHGVGSDMLWRRGVHTTTCAGLARLCRPLALPMSLTRPSFLPAHPLADHLICCPCCRPSCGRRSWRSRRAAALLSPATRCRTTCLRCELGCVPAVPKQQSVTVHLALSLARGSHGQHPPLAVQDRRCAALHPGSSARSLPSLSAPTQVPDDYLVLS